ncbi:MMPL family transporter [Arthrobacter caoxuetaonis]|uniref:MMPL family transporter n=1 Tax=Arthrobacter caoxuetaonis TaxID=2886935 RepID=A0A9X1MFN8_9MICC|nr:MMPL family transporter [Arthrobacter caoxuetaonis]MCC3297784.1 MMPL family transporter [Arthrobacter caoxuetaonis]USQ56022.1 MMPL family transporter [Arthrobacter caoxuetaonis]
MSTAISPNPGPHERPDADSARPGPPAWLRILIPVVLIIVWFVVGGIGGPYFGKISEVTENDQSSYLPASSASTQVADLQAQFSDSNAIPAVVIFVNDAGLTDADKTFIEDRTQALAGTQGVDGSVSPVQYSEDGKAAELFVPVADDSEAAATVENLRSVIADGQPQDLSGYVTGPAGQLADISDAFGGIDGTLLLVAVGAVLLILIIVYRSPLLPILVLLTSIFALSAAILVVYWLADADLLSINGQVQGILFILGIGAATDYSLLYVSRYRESLRDHRDRWTATWAALKGTFEPVLASAATVIAGLLCLLLSDLNSNKALAPVASIGIAFSFLSAMTLLPALLFVFGRAAFWPRRPAVGSGHAELDHESKGLWARTARIIRAHPRRTWLICAVVLAIAAIGTVQFRASGVPQSDFVLGETQSADGQEALGEHFPSGSGSPVLIIAPQDELQAVANTVLANPNINSVTVAASGTPAGQLPVTSDGVQVPPIPGAESAAPKTVDGKVLLEATLTQDADSPGAEDTVRDLRSDLSEDEGVLVGGTTATNVDTNDAALHDRNLIIPVVLVVILFLLMLLLRAILAPVLLILTVMLSFGATLGISALLFNYVLDFPGADPAVPLYGFIFLVALGVDYNIFLMTRVREESIRHGTRDGVIRGLMITGGVITSAGIVLAATFAALGVIPVLFLAQLAFIVSFGVLLDTLVVRSLLVPALSYDIGPRIWWPSKLGRPAEQGKAAAGSR